MINSYHYKKYFLQYKINIIKKSKFIKMKLVINNIINIKELDK